MAKAHPVPVEASRTTRKYTSICYCGYVVKTGRLHAVNPSVGTSTGLSYSNGGPSPTTDGRPLEARWRRPGP